MSAEDVDAMIEAEQAESIAEQQITAIVETAAANVIADAKEAAKPAITEVAPAPPRRLFPRAQTSAMRRNARYLRALFYGAPGVGKTVLAGSSVDVERMRDVIAIDADAGTMSIDHIDGVDSIPVTELSHVAGFSRFLRRHCELRDSGDEEALAQLQERYLEFPREEGVRHYRTLIIDSLNEVQKLVAYKITNRQIGSVKLDEVPDTLSRRDWGTNAEMLRSLIREVRSLPMNVIITCAEKIAEDDERKRFYSPNLPGQLVTDILGFVDVVGWMAPRRATVKAEKEGEKDKQEIRRVLHLQPQATYHAKNRIPGFDDAFLVNPTMNDLISRLQ